MKKFNWKLYNLALWTELILSYILPFKVIDNFQYKIGFPIPFITVYDTQIAVNPLMSLHLNPLGLFLNGFLIYLIVSICTKAYQKIKLVSKK
ncbi:MAG: hypothetical protein PHG02_00745 [Oscillospiraceae bacterium]|nr:hypothetical protein [Oscillospiraceae bacterium]